MKTIEKIKKLQAEHARLIGEKQRHEQMAVSLQAEESEMMNTVNLDDPVEFEKVSRVRLRREIVPRKIKSFEESAERTKVELAAECSKATTTLLDLIQGKIDTLTAKIAKGLKTFFPMETDATDAAKSIVYDTPGGAVLNGPKERLNSGNFQNRDAFSKADELLKLAAIVEGVEI
jgi:hypothetical protein